MEHKHSVYDTDTHFSISPVTRQIKAEATHKTVLIQHDHNSERFSFDLQRYIDGHDMLKCNKVEIHYNNIDSSTKEQKKGVYEVDDLQISPDDENKVVCSWLISNNATQLVGSLNFLLRFCCVEDGVVVYAWNTAINSSISISSGISNGDAAVEEYPDILAQWKNELFGVGDTEEQRLLNVSAEQQGAITAHGAAVLASIPEEYGELSAKADTTERIKAPAIILNAEGESIVANDSAEAYLQGLKVFGKSTQDGEPTPDNPQEIHSVENAVVKVHRKNLIEVGHYSLNGTSLVMPIFEGALKLPCVFSWHQGFDQSAGSALFSYTIDGTQYFRSSDEFSGKCQIVFNDGDTLTKITLLNWANDIGELSEMQLEIGDTATEYEPYKEPQTITIPHTLPGIPVASGGNYTDENGQQWICDEIDLARGVKVQRICPITLDGNIIYQEAGTQIEGTYTAFAPFESIWIEEQNRFISDAFKCYSSEYYKNSGAEGIYTNPGDVNCNLIILRLDNSRATNMNTFKGWLSANPVTVYCPLKNPIETPLSDAEISAFKALISNKPTTTILNDSGAFMGLEYVADTKTYIDNLLKG